ncbi:YxiJ family protein [Neobacillus sp. SM06]|uniref:YxiJ family protein n=1 Tax=Neobacillus sp. SM06 TaxID=3422492 RepID=UPI003D269540
MQIEKELLSKLKNFNNMLKTGFPSEDIEKIEKDIFHDGEQHFLAGDFDSYCSLIRGSLGYVLSNRKIPRYQRELLNKDFFAMYPHYSYLKQSLQMYPEFERDLIVHENTRELLLEVIKLYKKSIFG